MENKENNSESSYFFTFAGTTFQVIAYYQDELFRLYQISRSRGRDTIKTFTIDEGRSDCWSLEHAALVAIDHQRSAQRAQEAA